MKYLLAILLFLSCILMAGAQEFGGNRFSTRWRQLDTDTARIIFPRGLDTSAARVANLIHTVAEKNNLPLGEKLKKINIVLQPHTTISNGYVGLGPFRSEFYMNPPADNFDLGTINWADQLALHEYRHVQQYNNFFNGASKAMRWLFGEEGYALAINASIPNWFYEGDAVFQETILSPQGRGRMPAFLKAYPALWQAGKNYSWMKLRNGSLKDYVPNHYDMGYLLVNYGYEKYGTDFWKNVTQDASAFKGLFYPMQKAVKKYSGINYKQFTKSAFEYYENIYGSTDNLQTANDYNNKQYKPKPTVTDYRYPQQVSPDSIIYLKTSYKNRPAFYIKDKGAEKRLRFRDVGIDEQFSYKNGKIVYAAFETHPRWQWNNYSVIKMLDVKTNKQKTLQSKTRYFSPDISEDGKTIVANHVSLNGLSSLILLKTDGGNMIKEIKSDSITYFSNPKFISNNKVAAAIRLLNGKSFIGMIDVNTGAINSLTPASYNIVGQVSVTVETVYFTGADGLRDGVYAVDIKTKKILQLNINSIANYFPNAGYGKMNYSNFTALGYKMQQLKTDETIWKNISADHFTKNQSGIISEKYVDESGFIDTLQKREFISKPYAKLTRPFHFHSWRPNFDDPIFDFTVYGNNVLNTVETQLQYQYNQNDQSNALGGSLVYGGLFPFISLGSKYTIDRNVIAQNKVKEWNQWDNYAGISIPLNWTSNKTYKFFNWSTTYSNRTDFNKGIYRDSFQTVRFGYLFHNLSWAQQIQKARLDIFPRWGYNLNAQFRHALNVYSGWQFYSKANLFLPGFFPTHSFYITTAYQESSTKDMIFSNRFPFARGFNAVDSAKLWGVTFNYHFPIAYPDWGFANIFYLQRLRAGMFYDYTQIPGKTISYKKELMSAGTELYFDTKWWNQHPVTFGVRGGYLLKPDPVIQQRKFFFEFILPVSLIPR